MPKKSHDLVTAERRGTDGNRIGAEMSIDDTDVDGKPRTTTVFISTRHDADAIARKQAAGWRLCDAHAAAAEKFGDAAEAAAAGAEALEAAGELAAPEFDTTDIDTITAAPAANTEARSTRRGR